MAQETCPACGSLMELVRMDDAEVLKCKECGHQIPIRGAEPWEPIESRLIVGSIAAGIIAMVVLFAAIYYTILIHYS